MGKNNAKWKKKEKWFIFSFSQSPEKGKLSFHRIPSDAKRNLFITINVIAMNIK